MRVSVCLYVFSSLSPPLSFSLSLCVWVWVCVCMCVCVCVCVCQCVCACARGLEEAWDPGNNPTTPLVGSVPILWKLASHGKMVPPSNWEKKLASFLLPPIWLQPTSPLRGAVGPGRPSHAHLGPFGMGVAGLPGLCGGCVQVGHVEHGSRPFFFCLMGVFGRPLMSPLCFVCW